MTIHLWVENWDWFDPADPSTLTYAVDKAFEYLDENIEIANINEKPAVLEEFGIARDYGSYDPNSSTDIRDLYYSYIFDYITGHVEDGNSNIVGANFWAYAGHGRPTKVGGDWEPGDELIGDPPFEKQGWYSVYNNDTTIGVIALYADILNDFSNQI